MPLALQYLKNNAMCDFPLRKLAHRIIPDSAKNSELGTSKEQPIFERSFVGPIAAADRNL